MALSAQNPPLHAADYAPALALRTGPAQAQPWTRCIWEMPVYIGPVWFGILAIGYRLTKSRELAVA
jgi:hypothetical protein